MSAPSAFADSEPSPNLLVDKGYGRRGRRRATNPNPRKQLKACTRKGREGSLPHRFGDAMNHYQPLKLDVGDPSSTGGL